MSVQSAPTAPASPVPPPPPDPTAPSTAEALAEAAPTTDPLLPVKGYFAVYALLLAAYVISIFTVYETLAAKDWVAKAFPGASDASSAALQQAIDHDRAHIQLGTKLSYRGADDAFYAIEPGQRLETDAAIGLAQRILMQDPKDPTAIQELTVYKDGPFAWVAAHWAAIFTYYNVFGLFFLAVVYGKAPILGALEENGKKTREALEQARKAQAEAEALKRRYQDLLAELEAEKARMAETAQTEIAHQREHILKTAKHEAEGLMESVRASIEADLLQAKRDLRRRVAEEAVAEARRRLAADAGGEDHDRAFETLLGDLQQVKLHD